jgi:hypothetical protein
MKSFQARIKGISPLLMHNNEMANPLSIYAKAMKPYTSKRNKTESDHEIISRMEWEAGLYLMTGQVVLPGANIHQCLLEGAKKNKNGPKIKSGVFIDDDYPALDYAGPKIKLGDRTTFPCEDLDKFYSHHKFTTLARVSTSTTLRTRPIFHGWSCEFTILYDETIVDEMTIMESMETAGRMVGICDWRPRYGRFEAEKID